MQVINEQRMVLQPAYEKCNRSKFGLNLKRNNESMPFCTGWILDVSVEGNRAIIWMKTSERQALKLFDTYEPTFYVLPKGAEIYQKLSNENNVMKV